MSRDGRYLLRHWRGEIGLREGFWVNYVVLYAGLTTMSMGILASATTASFRLIATYICLSQGAILLAFVWMAVGNWRSAGHHIHKTGHRFWPWMARGILCLHAVAIGFVLVPYCQLMSKIAVGLDPLNDYELVRTDENSVSIEGHIGANLPADLEAVLNGAREVEWIRLNSSGGWAKTAWELRDIITARDLRVSVGEHCESACFLVFMAADVRAIHPTARIGMHSAASAMGSDVLSVLTTALIRPTLVADGVPEAFLDKALSTPAEGMWYPTTEELIQAGVVTHILVDGELTDVRHR